MKATAMAATSLLMLMSSVHAEGLTTSADGKNLAVSFGQPTIKQVLHYRKMYDKSRFRMRRFIITITARIKSFLRAKTTTAFTLCRASLMMKLSPCVLSLPSADWGNKTAFHQLTFIRGDRQNVFIQNAIVDTGEAIAQQNGTYTQEKHRNQPGLYQLEK